MAYGQKYLLEYWRGTAYPINEGIQYKYIAKIFQQGYITGGGIILSPAQVTSSSNLRVGGISVSATDGLITFPWTPQLITTYGEYPLIWAYFNSQWQNLITQINNTDNPAQITIDLGTIPATNTVFVIKKADVSTLYTIADITGTGGIITQATTGFNVYWIYFDGQAQFITPVLDDNDAPTSVTIDLGAIPGTNSYLQSKVPDAVLTYSQADIISSGGIITFPVSLALYGQYPKIYAVFDGQFQPITPVVTPSQITIDLGTIPSGNTHILIVSGGYAVGIQELQGATDTPITLQGIQSDPRDKMQPLKGSRAAIKVIAGNGFDLENMYTDDEREYYTEIGLEKPDDVFIVNWSNFETPNSTTVDADLRITKYSPASNPVGEVIVLEFVNNSGAINVLRGDRIVVDSYSTTTWPTVDNPYLRLDVTGNPSLMTDVNSATQTIDFIIEQDVTVTNQTYYETDFIALRSELFYNSTSGYPVAYSVLYHDTTQAGADNLAATDPDYYTNGQIYADAWPIGYPAIWRGFFVIDSGTGQAYQKISIVELSFVDGIGLLKNLLFADAGGNYFLGKSTPKDIFYDCLNRLGIPDMNFYIRAEIFEHDMDETEDSMVQVLHQLETYYLSTQTKPLDMGQVIESVCRVYGLELRQNLGEWWFTQIDSLFDAGDGTWFKYSYITGDSLGSIEKDWTVTLGCSSGTFDTIFALADQMKIIDRAYRGQILNYQFKAVSSLNSNPSLTPIPDSGWYLWPGWTVDPLGSGNVQPGSAGGGAQMNSIATRPTAPPVLSMTSEDIPVGIGDLLQFNINFNNTGPVAFGQFQITFDNGVDIYYLNPNDSSWVMTTPLTFYALNGDLLENPAIPGSEYLWAKDSDLSLEIKAAVVPGAGHVNIILYNYDYSQNNTIGSNEMDTPGYPDFSGSTTWNLAKTTLQVVDNNADVPLGTFYIAANVGTPTFTPPILPVLNADDTTAAYVGTLYRTSAPLQTTTVWHRRGSVESKPLLWIIAETYVRMYTKPYRIMTGTIYLWYPQLTRFIIDGWEGVYMNVGTDHNLGSNLNNANLIQINNIDIVGAPTTLEETDYGQYNNGDLPVIKVG